MNKQFLLQNDIKNTQAISALAEAQLREILDKLKGNVPLLSIKGTVELDKLLNFSTQYEARLLALQTIGDPESFRAEIIELVEGFLEDIIILQDFLADKEAIVATDLVKIARIKIQQKDSVTRFGEITDSIRSIPKDGKAPPLQALANQSSDRILRIVMRSIIVDEFLERDLATLFSSLVYEAHKSGKVVPLILKDLDKEAVQFSSYQIAEAQDYRDEAGSSLAILVKAIARAERLSILDSRYIRAHNATVNFLVKMYESILIKDPTLRRTPEEVEEIKRELLSDIEMPVAPIAPVSPATSNTPVDDLRSQIPANSGVRDDKEAAPAAFADSIPSAPLPPAPKPQVTPVIFSAPVTPNDSNTSRSPIESTAFPVRGDTDTDLTSATPNTSIAPSAPIAPQNKENVTINKIERPSPQKDKLNPIQRIDLE